MAISQFQRLELRGDYCLEDLPRSSPIYLYTGPQQCSEILLSEFNRFQNANHALVREYHDNPQPDLDVQQLSNLQHQPGHQPRDLTDYILFRFANPSLRDEYLNSEDTPNLSVLSGDLLLLKMVTFEHGGTKGLFDKEICVALSPMGLLHAIRTFSDTTIKPLSGDPAKQADEAWGPVRPPRGYPRDKPTVVLEVGVSESSAKLRRDAQFWLDSERGQTNFVITCKVDRKMPIITIDTWERTETRAIQCSQHVVLSKKKKKGEEIGKTHNSLTIPFSHLFRREPEEPREGDVVLGEESLERIAMLIWMAQGFWDEES